MQYITYYDSPLGRILLSADDKGLTGAWFEGQKYYARTIEGEELLERDTAVLSSAMQWLDAYFAGKKPAINVPLHPKGTSFQMDVWKILCSIPYGHVMTYKEIAEILASNRRIAHMSAQAVGGAVGHNPISILIPCHRVVGSDGSLTGYAGGLARKKKLLALEKR